MSGILFGSSGIPHSAQGGDTGKGIQTMRKLGLDAMELSFTHGAHLNEAGARAVRAVAEEAGIKLSIHGPYYINLFALEKQKLAASKARIWQCMEIGEHAGADYVCFHPAYYMKEEPRKVYAQVRDILAEMIGKLHDRKMRIRLAPETTGKGTQFGSLEETLELGCELPELLPVFDFCHLHARENGKFKRKEDVVKVFEQIEAADRRFLRDFRMQVSGVKYSEKGELSHLPLADSDFPWKWLMECLKEFKVQGVVICESPQLEFDAMAMRDYYNGLE